MNNNILNRILIDWNDSDVEDSGLIKVSDVENQMKCQLIYKIDKRKSIRIFYIDIEDIPDTWWTYSEYKDKVYINGEHVQLEDGCTVNVYKPGEYRVYIEDFDKIEEIEDFAFYECTDLMSIIIPNSVTTIRSHAFEGCSSLSSVTIPNSVTLLDNYAFSDCTSLTSIDIPNTIREIYPSAFSGCTGLTSVTIPNSVTKIDNSVFSDCTSLTSVTIPNSVTEIGNCAFYGCTNLKTIYVESISKFEKIKFRGGWGAKTKLLGNVELVELKNRLNESLLQWDDSSDVEDAGIIKASDVENRMKYQLVYKLDIPQRIKIFDDCFTYFDEFKNKVYINGEHLQLKKDGYTVNEYEPGEYYVYIDGFNELNEISNCTFFVCTALTSITIPNSVTIIGDQAFDGCTSLVSVTIPDSVSEIGYAAFSECTSLTSITIPDSVTEIGVAAFRKCGGLTEMTIGNSVTKIGDHVFYGCINLKTIYVKNINKFKKIKFGGYGDKTKLLGNVELVELKNRLNESLIDWGNTDYSDEQEIISTNNVRTSMIFSGCDLMNYTHWLTYLDDKNMKTNLVHIVSSILNVLDKDQYFINRSAMHSSVLSNAHGEFKDHFVNKVLKNINPDIETFDDHHFLYWDIKKNLNGHHMLINALNKLDRNLYSVFNAKDLFGNSKDEDKQEYIILPMCPIEGKDILLLYFSIWNEKFKYYINNGEYSMGELGVVLNPVILE